ncbi:hypothetical protein ACI784_09190 [Geodermatophilus sp. SYSU D01186]
MADDPAFQLPADEYVFEVPDNGEFAPLNARIVPSVRPMIEFYDRRRSVTPFGQRICSYYVETFLGGRSYESYAGLDLHMGSPSWKLAPEARHAVTRWAREVLELY